MVVAKRNKFEVSWQDRLKQSKISRGLIDPDPPHEKRKTYTVTPPRGYRVDSQTRDIVKVSMESFADEDLFRFFYSVGCKLTQDEVVYLKLRGCEINLLTSRDLSKFIWR